MGITPARGIPLLRQCIECEACRKSYGILAGIPDSALRRVHQWRQPRCTFCGTKLRQFRYGGVVQFYRCDSCWRTTIVQE